MSLVFEQVHKTFVSRFPKKEVDAVVDLNLIIHSGEIFGIVGPNGAGKSTILKMLMGFIRPTSGKMTVLGSSPANPQVRFKIGYLPENPYFYDHLSGEELMRFSAETSGMNPWDTEKNIGRLLKMMNLEHARSRKLRSYSKGMTQRAGICFALIHDPELVILDEPMSGLDPLGRRLVVDLILGLKAQKRTVLFCSHILNDVERLCDRMAIMDHGRLKVTLTKQDMLEQHGQVALAVKELPDSLLQKLDYPGTKAEKRDGFWNILCPRESISDVLSLVSAQGIEIIGLDTTSNTLEKIFLKVVDTESER